MPVGELLEALGVDLRRRRGSRSKQGLVKRGWRGVWSRDGLGFRLNRWQGWDCYGNQVIYSLDGRLRLLNGWSSGLLSPVPTTDPH